MKPIKLFLVVLSLLVIASCQRCQIKKESASIKDQWSDVVAYAEQHLPKEGTLIQKSDGYAYLKVDDNYIHELFSRLDAEAGFKKPPYFRRTDAPGAHISVIYENEHVTLAEVGKKFQFTLNNIILVQVNSTTSYIVLQVTAPQLTTLRQRYGLSPKLNNHEFHITLAKKIEKNVK